MSFSNDFLAQGDRATHLDMLPYHQTQTTELSYPDPTSLITQPLLHHEDPLPGTFDPYLQPWAADVNGQHYFLPDFMQYPGVTSPTSGEIIDYCSPNQTQTTLHTHEQMTAYNSPYQTQLMSPTFEHMRDYYSPYQTQPTSQASNQMLDYCSPYETQTTLQTQEQIAAYHGPYQTRLLSQTLGHIPDYHSLYQTQTMSKAPEPMLEYHSPYQTDLPMTDPGINHQLPSPTSLSPEDSTALQGPKSRQKCGNRKSPSMGNDGEYLQRGNRGAPSAKQNRRKRKPATSSSLAPAQSLQQPDLGKQSRASRAQKVSKLGQLKAKLGDTMGSDNRAREKVLWDNETLFGWVDKEWKPAVYHAEIREKLILLDAQRPGAPVWKNGMPLDYTSYSPITRGWTSDPASIRDLKGRQVCLMRRPPKDWTHNPKTGFLTHEGLVVLDENNRPIKDFPGAPLALSNKAPAHILEGLRRTFGMTISDARARMPIRYTRLGPKPLQSNTTFTNRIMLWKKEVNKGGREIMFSWHDRTKNKAAKETANTSSGPQNDDDEEAESISGLVLTPSIDMNESSRILDGNLDPWETSAAMTALNGFMQHSTCHVDPLLPETGLY